MTTEEKLTMDFTKHKTFTVDIKEIFPKENKYTAKKLNEWFVKENLYDDNLLCDISNVNYTKYHTAKRQKLIPLTPLFCDNIMLFTLQPVTEMDKHMGKLQLKESTCGFINTKIREILKANNIKVVGHSVKCKNTIKYNIDTKIKEDGKTIKNIKNIMLLKDYIETDYYKVHKQTSLENAFVVSYKLELADENVDMLLPKLEIASAQENSKQRRPLPVNEMLCFRFTSSANFSKSGYRLEIRFRGKLLTSKSRRSSIMNISIYDYTSPPSQPNWS